MVFDTIYNLMFTLILVNNLKKIKNCLETNSALKLELQGLQRTVIGLENVTAMKGSVKQSPRSARRHGVSLQLFDQSVKISCIEIQKCIPI